MSADSYGWLRIEFAGKQENLQRLDEFMVSRRAELVKRMKDGSDDEVECERSLIEYYSDPHILGRDISFEFSNLWTYDVMDKVLQDYGKTWVRLLPDVSFCGEMALEGWDDCAGNSYPVFDKVRIEHVARAKTMWYKRGEEWEWNADTDETRKLTERVWRCVPGIALCDDDIRFPFEMRIKVISTEQATLCSLQKAGDGLRLKASWTSTTAWPVEVAVFNLRDELLGFLALPEDWRAYNVLVQIANSIDVLSARVIKAGRPLKPGAKKPPRDCGMRIEIYKSDEV